MTGACDDLLIKFESIRRKLLRSGADLSKIRITMDKNSAPSYVTKRIMKIEKMRKIIGGVEPIPGEFIDATQNRSNY